MAPRKTTNTTVTPKGNSMPELKFEESKTFPTVTRISASTSQFLAPCEAMVKAGKSFRLAGLERADADKVANNMRQVMKRVHNRSLSAVYNPDEKALYVRDGGEVKVRGPRATKATKAVKK